MKNRFALIVGILVLGASVIAGAQVSEEIPLQGPAQGPQGQAQPQTEPTSSVARISLTHGDVSTQRGDSGDWAAAAQNQPVVSGDKVSTGVGSRAEVQLDSANILRMGDSTLASIAGLSRTQIQIQVERGLIDYTVFKGTEAEVEIDTANAAVRPAQKDGIYRVEINAEGETELIVRKGSAEISTPQGSTQVEKGQMAIVRGTGADTQYKLAEAPSRDSWDTWNSDRDRIIYDAQSWGNTNRYYTGSEDLDANGRWTTVPDYGPVWTPAVGPGWAPYRSGRWVWEPGWGWTWVSYEPWGWAPYHYGRWFVYNSSWVWWPGPARGYPGYRPVWAPAYVSFFGFGGGVGVGVGFGFGSVGWLPIGPCDTFYPWYGRYGSRYNVVNITTINNFNGRGRGFGGIAPLRAGGAYSNLRLASTDARVRGGLSTVPTGQFGTGRSTPVGVSGETFRGGRMIAGNLPVVPTRAALSASNRPAAASTLPRGGGEQRFFSKSRPAAAPQSFDRQVSQMQQSIQRNGAGAGQPFSRGESAVQNRPQMQNQGPARGTLSTANGGVARSTTSDGAGWRRFSDSSTAQRDGGMNRSAGPAANSTTGRSTGTATFNNNVPRPGNSSRPDASTNDGNWRHFTPQSGGGPADRVNNGGGGMYSGRGSGPEFQGNQMSRPQIGGGRAMAQDSPRGYSRPPLEMRQPIVTPRGSESRGSAPRESAPSRSGGGGGGGGGSHGGSGGSPHGGSGRH
jgi:FecR protein